MTPAQHQRQRTGLLWMGAVLVGGMALCGWMLQSVWAAQTFGLGAVLLLCLDVMFRIAKWADGK